MTEVKGKVGGPDVTRPDSKAPMVFVHVGDLHMTALAKGAPPIPYPNQTEVLKVREARLRRDFDHTLRQIAAAHARFGMDFVYLPGDLADDGCAPQYDAIAKVLRRHALPPIRVIPGDHDRQHGRMGDFAAFLRTHIPGHPASVTNRISQQSNGWPAKVRRVSVEQFYYARTIRGVRCIFLDLVSAGFGRKGHGLDFRLGDLQFEWLKRKVKAARAKCCPVAVFMHSYPEDFRERDEGSLVAGLIWNSGVALVEMGHTHYNELGHDGRTTYGSVRSVGQNEDGPAGFAVVAYDNGVVSWRFKQLQQTWPYVMITSPADRRLATSKLDLSDGTLTIRAIVLSGDGDPAGHRCRCSVDKGAPVDMKFKPGEGVFEAKVLWPAGSRIVTVTAVHGPIDGHDSFDFDIVEPDSAFVPKPMPERPGSDAFAIGPWLKKGVRGDQLGPNKGGRKW